MSAASAPRVLFVNAGMLGLTTFHTFLQEELPTHTRIEGELLLLPEHLSFTDRAVRRALTLRLWRDGWFGVSNLDLARFRAELNTGLHARRRIAQLDPSRFDVLFFHRQSAAWGSLDLMQRIPSIVSIDATQDAVIAAASRSVERRTYGLNARVDGAVFRRAAAIVSTSRWAADALAARYPDVRTPVHVLPPPAPLDRFDRSWSDERAARHALGRMPRVLFVGGDFLRKGGPELLEAWRTGGFGSHAALDLVTDWRVPNLPDGVTLRQGITAFSEAWTQRWREADVFALPTRNEAFGLVFQEAAAAGLPSIATRLNAIPEIVEDGSTGLLISPGDRHALIRALRTLIDNAALRDRMGRAARTRIESIADPYRYLDQLADVAHAVRGRHPPALR